MVQASHPARVLSCAGVLLVVAFCSIAFAQDIQKASKAEAKADKPEAPAKQVPLKLTNVELTGTSFNPTRGKSGGVRFDLNRPAKITVVVYGPNEEEVRRLVDKKEFKAGNSSVTWDGRDRDGNIVPDEAYFFTVQAAAEDEGVVVDPLLASGGERIIATDLNSFEDGRRLSYKLPRACRVLVRAAVVDGPLLRTVVNWEPRCAGLALESWDGMDEDGFRQVLEVSESRIAVMAYALPDLSVITIGNQAVSYRDYYNSKASKWPKKTSVVRQPVADGVLSPYATFPPHLNRDPKIKMTLVDIDPPENASAEEAVASGATLAANGGAKLDVPVISTNPVLVRVDIPDPLERAFMNEQKFELVIYIDDRRVQEVEQGHVPFTYPWDVSMQVPGRHVLTVNVASFRNHVGTVSRAIDFQP